MDIAQNSIKAGAENILLELHQQKDKLYLRVMDDGCGMDEETVRRVTDPFYTTRTTRKVGMGIPLLKQNAGQTGGHLNISSKPGKGTKLTALFVISNIDCPPLGDVYVTIPLLITGNPDVNIVFRYILEEDEFEISTKEIKEAMGDMDISMPKVTAFLKDMIKESLTDLGAQFD